MYDVEADTVRNRLYIDLTGRLDGDTIEEAASVVVDEARRLDEGFDVVTDLSGFTTPSPEDAKPIKQTQAELKRLGVDRVVRVEDEDTSHVVVRAFERRSEDVGYTGEVAESRDAADRLLSERSVTGHQG